MTSNCICPKQLDSLVMIEYPGIVKNVDKALDTLGGIESVQKVFNSQKDRLELKFRKSDPLAHPAYGDRAPKKCLVLRIHKSKPAQSSESADNSQFKVSVVGKIQTSYKFETLAEFQWLPMQRTNIVERLQSDQLQHGVTINRSPESLDPKYASILDDVLPIKDPFDNTLKNFNPDAPLLLMPAVFSRFDTPREIHQPHPRFRSKEMREEFERQQSLSIIDDIPEGPPERLLKEKTMLSAQERSLIPKLERCFLRQQVWSKASLCFELNCQAMDIKYILPLIAFHYLNGPFRTMWVKYGYNPHKDTSSKLLQALDFRVKNSQDQQEYSRRCVHQYQLPMRKNVEKLKTKAQLDLKKIISNNSEDPLDDSLCNRGVAITEAMCKFKKDLIPMARQLSYQLKDIEIDEVQAIVHSNDGKEPKECSERDGWLPEGSIDRIRKIMTKSLSGTVDLMTSQLEEG